MYKANDLQTRAIDFSLEIIKFLDDNKSLPHSIRDQLLRASCSVGANLVEARGSGSKKEFARFYQIALKSANETEYWLLLLQKGYKCNVEKYAAEIRELQKIVASSLITMRNS